MREKPLAASDAENAARYDSLTRCLKDIDLLFRFHTERLSKLRGLAASISEKTEKLGTFVERHTAIVCPTCISVCCTNRHSYHTSDDIIYIYAAGERMPRHTAGLDDSAPCQFLGVQGCTIPRSLRPYRCNWYFCTPLLEHLLEHNSNLHYHLFINLLQEITGVRQKMMEEYASVSENIVGRQTSDFL